MAKLKYEFLDHYHRANGLPLRNRMFGRIEVVNRLGSSLAPLSNWLAGSAFNRWIMELVAGVDRRRPLPQFAAEAFETWFRKHAVEGNGSSGEVVLFYDTFNNFNTPNVAIAATRFLEKSGYRVSLAEKKCCGRPMISKGMLAQARENAAWNLEKLLPHAEKGTAIVGLEPSCLLTLRDEYPEFIRTAAAQKVAEQSLLLEEFVLRELGKGKLRLPPVGEGKNVLLHGHCHQKALVGTGPTVKVLQAAGYQVC
jgi:Fe-S oxidoreductase